MKEIENNKIESDSGMIDITEENKELSEDFNAIKNRGDEIRKIRTAYGDKMNAKYVHKDITRFELRRAFKEKYGIGYEDIKKAKKRGLKELRIREFE
jgi:hypothetical protein